MSLSERGGGAGWCGVSPLLDVTVVVDRSSSHAAEPASTAVGDAVLSGQTDTVCGAGADSADRWSLSVHVLPD